MNDNTVLIGVGLILIVASILAKGISFGMPPHNMKPLSPATQAIRIFLLSIGLLSLGLGMFQILRK